MPSLHKEYLTLVPPSVNLQCVFGGSCPSEWQNKMVMSQGTYTFLSCFAGFWLIWGLIVLLCCLCSFLRRRMKRRREERLREQSLRSVQIEPLQYEEYVSSPRIPVAHRMRAQAASQQPPPAAQARPWSATRRNGPTPSAASRDIPSLSQEPDLSQPPCYEEALLMAEPPPPYSEVLTDTRGIYRKILSPFLTVQDELVKPEQPLSHKQHLAGSPHTQPLPGALSSPITSTPPQEAQGVRRPSWSGSEIGSGGLHRLPRGCQLIFPIPLLGRTTAV
ncbi:proline-rich protein 7 isoform 1-T4 [Anomaloglossus baeobatrachus]|uniref:proline-rich protein 7 n=1 Tax=Anomaloglossus baeobatrachus TaxID=238106 RepID=UPI003F4FA3F4